MNANLLRIKHPILNEVSLGHEVVWINPKIQNFAQIRENLPLGMEDILEAEERLRRFAPFIRKCFPETEKSCGIIESELRDLGNMQKALETYNRTEIPGRFLCKLDSELPIAGSVKARGGIYEVLKHAEELAIEQGMLNIEDDYAILTQREFREFFHRYKVQVGSTGNLGLSIGIMSAALGFQVTVHMSADAKQWKKDLLRQHGVSVVEYASDYSEAVRNGRKLSDEDSMSYFVDDENSENLFLGYAAAALRLEKQLRQMDIPVDEEHPLIVYLPCGVGGAPGGITFGLKQVFGDFVHCFFVEPTQAPCMLIGMETGLHNQICVQDLGLSGVTHADGLAVGRASGFVGKVMEPLLSGEFTVSDAKLYDYMRLLMRTENCFIEPSSCASFVGPVKLMTTENTMRYLAEKDLLGKLQQGTQIVWATGGRLVPEDEKQIYMETYPTPER